MATGKKKRGATIIDAQNNELMNISRIERDENSLVIRGKIFGAMPMVAKISPTEARKALKLLNFKMVLFLLTLLFRK